MNRFRTLKPEFWRHRMHGRISESSSLLAVALIWLADDDGRFIAEPDEIIMELFPLRKPVQPIEHSLSELAKVRFVELYTGNINGEKRAIGFIPGFLRHQRINRPTPSRLPAPPQICSTGNTLNEPSVSPHTSSNEPSVSPHTSSNEPSVSPHTSSNEPSVSPHTSLHRVRKEGRNEEVRKEGKKEGEREGRSGESLSQELSIPSEEEFLTWASNYPGEAASAIPPVIPARWAEEHYGHFAMSRPDKWHRGDWRRTVTYLFRCDWKNGNAKARGELEKKNAPAPAVRQPGDLETWWTDGYDGLSMELAGRSLTGTPEELAKRDRMREILKFRFPNHA
jgi:hypothetical protein